MSHCPRNEDAAESVADDATDDATRGVELLTPLIAVLAQQIANRYTRVEDGSATLIHAQILGALTLVAGALAYLMRS